MKSQAYYSAQEAWTDKEKQFEKCSAEARRKEHQCQKPPVSGAGQSHSHASAIIAGASVLVITAALLFWRLFPHYLRIIKWNLRLLSLIFLLFFYFIIFELTFKAV